MKVFKDYIVKNDIRGLLVEMRKQVGDSNSPFTRELDLLGNQWVENEKNFGSQLINNENYQVIRNKTINRLLDLIDELENKEQQPVLDPVVATGSSRSSKGVIWAGLTLLGVCGLIIFFLLTERYKNNEITATKEKIPTMESSVEQNNNDVQPATPDVISSKSPKKNTVEEKQGNVPSNAKPNKPVPVIPFFSQANANLSIAWFREGKASPIDASSLQREIMSNNYKSVATAESSFYEQKVTNGLLTGNHQLLSESNMGEKLLIVFEKEIITQTVEDSGNVFERETAEPERRLPLKVDVFDHNGVKLGTLAKTYIIDTAQYDNIATTRIALVYNLIKGELR